jgi:glycosyltransferase involved in cell wall biosynthesis
MSKHAHNRIHTGSNGTPRLSLCMIVKNEEQYLEGCLQSVQGVVDEIIVVDTGSTDRTVEIAARFGAKILPFVWENDFSAARNESLRHATGEWILYLDADERLAEGQTQLLRSLIKNQNAGAYMVTIEGDHYLSTGIIRQTNAYPRLFRLHPSVRFMGKVHEQITPGLMKLGLKVIDSSIVVEHLGYGQDFETVKKKCRRNIEILREYLHDHPDDGYTQFQIGNTLSVMEDYTGARYELETVLDRSSVAESIKASALNLLSEIDIREEKFDSAIHRCLESLKIAGYQVTARWYLAASKIATGNYLDAIDPLNGILEIHRERKSHHRTEIAFDILLDESLVNSRIGLCYESIQKYQEATEAYFRSAMIKPQQENILESLIRVQRMLGSPSAAIAQLEALHGKNVTSVTLLLALATNYRTIDKKTESYNLIRQISYLYPLNAEAYALEMTWRILDGDYQTAENIFSEAQQHGVTSYNIHKSAMDIALHDGDIPRALNHLEEMANTPQGNVSAVKDRIAQLRMKMNRFGEFMKN